MNDARIVCPCCPLHCDDLELASVLSARTGCSVADRLLSKLRSGDLVVDDVDSIEQARQWIADAHQIVISGHVIDLETSRAIAEFAKISGATVEVSGSNPTATRHLARDGGFLTTLGELRGRDRSVLMIGDVAAHWPRIEEHLRVERLSQPFPTPTLSLLRWPDSVNLPSRLAALRLQVAGRTASATDNDPELASTVELVIASKYLVLLVAPLLESISRSPVIWSSILGLVRERNKTSRAAILSFDPSVTVRSVLAARNDPPLSRFPLSDSILRIEFSPFGEPVAHASGRTIVIGMSDEKPTANQCVLQAAVPGLHHAGMVIRGDGSVTLPLQSCLSHLKAKDSIPTPADQLRRLIAVVRSASR